MTVSELYKQSAQLGFENSLESGDRFYYAANRALLQISALRPAISSCVINHKPLANAAIGGKNTFTPVTVNGERIYMASSARSYYFEADGNGEVIVERFADGVWKLVGSKTLKSTRRFLPYRGILENGEGAVRIRFTGQYLYSVRNVALYDELYSSLESDIPAYELFTAYDIRSLVDDFLSLSSPVIAEDEGYTKLNQECRVENGSIVLLPYSASGVYKVLYRRKPVAIKTENNPESNNDLIDLDEELCSLMPLLIASYVWVEDEPSMAEYYLNLYRERAAEIFQRVRNASPAIIRNSNGW